MMSSAEFTDWIAYYRLEPFGYEIDNFRYGTQTAAIVNTVSATVPRERGRRVKPLQASDYYPSTNAGVKKEIPLTPAQKEFIRRKKRGKRGHSNR